MAPTADRDSPSEVLQRTIFAALALIAFDWAWGALTHLSGLITDSLLRMPWVADGVERMLESLLIGGAAGTVVAAEFMIPLLLAAAGAVLFALMLLRIGLAVIASLVYATGGLALGLSVSGFGARLLQVWLVAATGVFVLPVLWCVVFVCASALMLDTGGAGGPGGFGDFVGQLYNTGAALVTFIIAIKLARATLGHATTAIAGLTATGGGVLSGGHGRPRPAAGGRATPQSLARFSAGLRGGMAGAAAGGARVAAFPVRHPVRATGYARHPVQATRDAAEHLRGSMRDGAAASATRHPGRTGQDLRGGQRDGRDTATGRPTAKADAVRERGSVPARRAAVAPPRAAAAAVRPSGETTRRSTSRTSPAAPRSQQVVPSRPSRSRAAAPTTDTAPPPRPAEGAEPPRPQTGSAAAARAWQTTRRMTAATPKRATRTNSTKRKP